MRLPSHKLPKGVNKKVRTAKHKDSEKHLARKEKKIEKMVEREKDFVPPKEDGVGEKKRSKKRDREEYGRVAEESEEVNGNRGKKKNKDKKHREGGGEKSSKKRKVEVEVR